MIKKIVLFEDANNGDEINQRRKDMNSFRKAIATFFKPYQTQPKIELYLFHDVYELNTENDFDERAQPIRSLSREEKSLPEKYKDEFCDCLKERKGDVLFLIDYTWSYRNEKNNWVDNHDFAQNAVDEIIRWTKEEGKSPCYCIVYTTQLRMDMKKWIMEKLDKNPELNKQMTYMAYNAGDLLGTKYELHKKLSELLKEQNGRR